MKKVGIGLIGTGFMGRAHAGCYQLDSRVNLVGVSSLDKEQGDAFITDFGFKYYTEEWQDFLSNQEIDIIDITAPNFLHAKMAIAAIEAGKAVLLEKPFAVNLKEAELILKALQRNPVFNMYAENRRFAPAFIQCKEEIENNSLGKIKLFRMNEMGLGPGHAAWFRNKELSGGGALIDLGIHGLGLCEWMLNTSIVSVSSMQSPSNGLEETMVSSVRFANGGLGQFVCSWGIQGGLDIRAEIFGDKGTILVDHSKYAGGLIRYKHEHSEEDKNRPHQSVDTGWSHLPVDEWNIKGHRNEIRHLIDSYLGEIPCRTTFQDGYRALKLASAFYQSAKEGREIFI